MLCEWLYIIQPHSRVHGYRETPCVRLKTMAGKLLSQYERYGYYSEVFTKVLIEAHLLHATRARRHGWGHDIYMYMYVYLRCLLAKVVLNAAHH